MRCVSSKIRRIQSSNIITSASDLTLRTIKSCSVVFGVTLIFLVIQVVIISHHQLKAKY